MVNNSTRSKIGDRCKPLIIFYLLLDARRCSELKKCIPAITEKMLMQHLKELEAGNILFREARTVVISHIKFSLCPKGQA